jgi:hypothetical protein
MCRTPVGIPKFWHRQCTLCLKYQPQDQSTLEFILTHCAEAISRGNSYIIVVILYDILISLWNGVKIFLMVGTIPAARIFCPFTLLKH